ncbi:hypothetical protein [Nitrospirillum sp. BR 11828]|uniref:hypothetical protein n=1 Tax=Nitrospirillum sp. BR 11828 TaxID=3104325 RepID=UPI002ACAEC75|nr:hypothetical protein [Nitrospirillum sp. BR 11828]MDZ5645846.1 hypothetical protein [Nitrospirillum sp. BR 11828]
MRALKKAELDLVAGGYDTGGQTITTITVTGHPSPSPSPSPLPSPSPFPSPIPSPTPNDPPDPGNGQVHTTPSGNHYTTNIPLTDAQTKVVDKIVDFGQQHGFTSDQIKTAVDQAYYESSFNQQAQNGNFTGLFQYNQQSWDALGHSNMDIHNEDDQIKAIYSDINRYTDRYSSGESSGAIPSSESFENYFEVKHHLGNNSTDWNSPTVADYPGKVSTLGFTKG